MRSRDIRDASATKQETRQPANTLLLGIVRQHGSAFQTATSDARAHVSQIHKEKQTINTSGSPFVALDDLFSGMDVYADIHAEIIPCHEG